MGNCVGFKTIVNVAILTISLLASGAAPRGPKTPGPDQETRDNIKVWWAKHPHRGSGVSAARTASYPIESKIPKANELSCTPQLLPGSDDPHPELIRRIAEKRGDPMLLAVRLLVNSETAAARPQQKEAPGAPPAQTPSGQQPTKPKAGPSPPKPKHAAPSPMKRSEASGQSAIDHRSFQKLVPREEFRPVFGSLFATASAIEGGGSAHPFAPKDLANIKRSTEALARRWGANRRRTQFPKAYLDSLALDLSTLKEIQTQLEGNTGNQTNPSTSGLPDQSSGLAGLGRGLSLLSGQDSNGKARTKQKVGQSPGSPIPPETRLRQVEEDLRVKADHCKDHPEVFADLVEVVAHTKSNGIEVQGRWVYWVPAIKEDDVNSWQPFDTQSPSRKALAPGIYGMSSIPGDPKTLERTIGGSCRNTQDIDVEVH